MHESNVFCSACTMSSLRKFTVAISSPDEFLVRFTLLTDLYSVACSLLQFNNVAYVVAAGLWQLSVHGFHGTAAANRGVLC